MRPNRPWRLFGLLMVWSMPLVQCRTTPDGAEAKFGWDDDLTPPKNENSQITPNLSGSPRFDRSFCRGAEPGSCFTFIVRVPTPDLISDMGLSVLALASGSTNFALRMDEACQAAWLDYKDRYKEASLKPLRRIFVNKIKKARCVFVPMSEEYVLENAPLADNEIGLSVRLTKFEIIGRNDSATVGFLKLLRDQTSIETQFRAVSTFRGKLVGGKKEPWLPVSSSNVSPMTTRQSFGKDVSWKFDTAAAIEILSKIDTTKVKDQTDQAVKSFVDKAKSAVGSAMGTKPSLGSSMILVGLGYEAYRSLCGEDRARCNITSSETSKTAAINEDLKDMVPTAEVNEIFRTAVIKSFQGIWDGVFEGSDKSNIGDQFKLQ